MTRCSKCKNIAVVKDDKIPFCVECYIMEIRRQKNKGNLWTR